MSVTQTTTAKDARNSFMATVCKPVDMRPNIQVKTEIVLRIIEECIEKFKISVLLPSIFNKSKTICRLLNGTEYNNCAKLLEKFIASYKKGPMRLPAKCQAESIYNLQLIQVIDAFQLNYRVIHIIEDFLQKLNYNDTYFVNTLQTLYETAKQRLYKEARAELLLEKRLHIFYYENKNVKNDIQKFQQKIMRSKNSLRWRIAAKEGIVSQIEEELDDDRRNREMIFQIEEKEADKKFRNAQISYQHRHKELEEEVERSGESLAKTYKHNYMIEQDVRAERNKLLIQLQTLTKRFDTVLAEKFKMNMALDKQLAELQHEFDEFFKNEYEQAEKVYNDIVMAAERKKRREFERKLALFVGNRAAKIIQRAWKRYMKIVREERGETVAKPKGKKK